MDVNGSPEFVLTWKTWDMPAGLPICALRALARRTSGNDFSGWPTPRTPTGGAESAERKQELGRTESGGGDLQEAVLTVAAWPTPQPDSFRSRSGDRKGEMGLDQLARSIPTAGWPTPMAGTPAQKGYNEAGNTDSGRKTVELVTGWATPKERDWRSESATPETLAKIMEHPRGKDLNKQVAWVKGWATPRAEDAESSGMRHSRGIADTLTAQTRTLGEAFSSPAPTESGAESLPTKPASLNPAFSLWLQGYPIEWARCGALVMRSALRSRRNSSAPVTKPVKK